MRLDRDTVRAVRASVRDVYGKALADKASDALCFMLTVQEAAVAEVASAPSGAGAVVRLATPPVREAAAAVPAFRAEAGDVGPSSGRDAARLVAIARARHAAIRAAEDIREFLATDSQATASPGGGATEEADYCWLSGAVQARSPMSRIAEVAGDDCVRHIDLPHRLEPELDVCLGATNVAAFAASEGLTGAGIIVGVLDTEVAPIDGLKGRVLRRENYTAEPWGSPGAHGTIVASIIAGDGHHPGVAQGATIYGYKVLATNRWIQGNDFQSALAIQQALEDGCHIINCSWGAGTVSGEKSQVAVACENGWALGMVVVKSAGNSGPGGGTVTRPGEADILVVGGTDRQGSAVGDYSSRGPLRVDGEDLDRPHLVAPGGLPTDPIRAYDLAGNVADAGYGTSYAAPHVAGAAALILEKEPGLSADEIRDRLLGHCSALSTSPSAAQGRGLLRFP